MIKNPPANAGDMRDGFDPWRNAPPEENLPRGRVSDLELKGKKKSEGERD